MRIVSGSADVCTLVHAQARHHRAEGGTHVFRSPIAVEDRPACGATRGRECKDSAGHCCGATAGQTPRENAPRVLIQYDREVAPAASHLEEGDVADPHLVRSRHVGRPQSIGMPRVQLMNVRLRAIALDGFRAQAGKAHELGDPAPAHAPAGAHERLMDAWAAIAFLVLREHPRDLRGQDAVLLRMRTLGTTQPRIEALGRHVIAPTQRRYAESRALRVDEGERVCLRAEQNRMAFLGAHAPPAAARAPSRGPEAARSRGLGPVAAPSGHGRG